PRWWIMRSCQAGNPVLTSLRTYTCRYWASRPRTGSCERETPPARLTTAARGDKAGGVQPFADFPGFAAERCLPAPGNRCVWNASRRLAEPISRRPGLRDHGPRPVG